MVSKNKQNDIHYHDDTRLTLLEQSISHINATLVRFEHRFDQLDDKFEHRFGQLDAKIEKLEVRIDSNFKWLLSIMIAGFGSLLGIIAHAQHWFQDR